MVKPAALLCAVTGCSYVTSSFVTNDFSGDPFPIEVDTSSGAILIGVSAAGDNNNHIAVLDVMSPVTLIDRGAKQGQSISTPNLTLLGQRGIGGPLDLPRAQLDGPQVLRVHPCAAETCSIGPNTAPRTFDALVGDSAFFSDALRLRLGSSELFVLPDIGGDETHRTEACDAVLPSPFRGGGTMILGGTELGFTNWRIAIDTCLGPRTVETLPQGQRGADVLLIASTAIGVSLLDETAYLRYADIYPAPQLSTLPDEIVFLPSGPITGKRVTIPQIALVANSSSSPRAPCRQVYAHRMLASRDCRPGDLELDCPCLNDTFCTVPAILELAPTAGIDMLVVPDDNTTLQALRTELRPDRPEVDGILGTGALQALEVDVDYPHDRLLARCTDNTTCVARPELTDRHERIQVDGCLGSNNVPFP